MPKRWGDPLFFVGGILYPKTLPPTPPRQAAAGRLHRQGQRDSSGLKNPCNPRGWRDSLTNRRFAACLAKQIHSLQFNGADAGTHKRDAHTPVKWLGSGRRACGFRQIPKNGWITTIILRKDCSGMAVTILPTERGTRCHEGAHPRPVTTGLRLRVRLVRIPTRPSSERCKNTSLKRKRRV